MKEFFKYIAYLAIFFAGVFFVIDFKNIVIAFNKPVDIYVDYPDDYNDVKAVKTEIDMILDRFATEETTTEQNGAITDRKYDYYYVVPVYTADEEDDVYFVGVKVSSEDKKDYEKVCDATWSYLYGETDTLETIEFEGGFKKMEEDCYKYFVEWFEDNEEIGLDKDDIDKYVLPLVLESVNLESTKKAAFILSGVILAGIVILVLCFRKGKEKEPEVEKYKRVIEVNGKKLHISEYQKVNKFVEKGNKEKAAKALMKIVEISEADANAAIADWDNIALNK